MKAIRIKISHGTLRKKICDEYVISIDTLIKNIDIIDDYYVIPKERMEDMVRLRIQGNTLQQTADVLSLTVTWVKKAWREKKDAPENTKKRVKYDNRTPLSKRDHDQDVNSVLKEGHTRTQINKQYEIKVLTHPRYIRAAQEIEIEKLEKKET